MDYIKVEFVLEPLLPAREILYADLDILNFETIQDTPKGAAAFMLEKDFTETILENLMVKDIPNQKVEINITSIKQENWNEKWESQFQPIRINEDCQIRAPFHETSEVKFDLVISPKMSFGTGHHETTFLMANTLFEHDLNGKCVLDMGCGTGVLAILAKKLGAGDTEGIDIEDWAFENSIENAELNDVNGISFFCGDVDLLSGKRFDMILANINRNILLDHMEQYATCLESSGNLLLSGFYTTDIEVIVGAGAKNGLKFVHSSEKNGWAMVQLTK